MARNLVKDRQIVTSDPNVPQPNTHYVMLAPLSNTWQNEIIALGHKSGGERKLAGPMRATTD